MPSEKKPSLCPHTAQFDRQRAALEQRNAEIRAREERWAAERTALPPEPEQRPTAPAANPPPRPALRRSHVGRHLFMTALSMAMLSLPPPPEKPEAP